MQTIFEDMNLAEPKIEQKMTIQPDNVEIGSSRMFHDADRSVEIPKKMLKSYDVRETQLENSFLKKSLELAISQQNLTNVMDQTKAEQIKDIYSNKKSNQNLYN